MKKITDHLNLNNSQTSLTKSQQETLPKTDLPIHWTTEIFKTFQARYLSKWSSQVAGIEERAVKEWSKGLHDLTGEDISNGLTQWVSEWPPTLSEFRDCCLNKSSKDSWQHESAAYKLHDTKRIGQIKADKETAREEMKKIRDKLK